MGKVVFDVKDKICALSEWFRLAPEARAVMLADMRGLPDADPGIEPAIEAAIDWLGRAQDNSASADGGAARDYSLLSGWSTSYPETSGYIVPTLMDYADWRQDEGIRDRARKMLDWLVSIQFPDGSFQGGRIDSVPVKPVTFNTGQILLGLARGAAQFPDEYLEPMRRAADWLVDTQDEDGCWRRFPTPFAQPGEKAYETHVSWGLFEAARLEPAKPYAEAALRNVRWALTHQRENGWFENCCLSDPLKPLAHTLGYVLRGVVEAFRYNGDTELLGAARRTADGLLTALRDDGFLPGRMRADWSGAAKWVCLTGSVQIAHSWLLLYETTGDERYRDAGFAANRYVRRSIRMDGPDGERGGVKGSFPVYGEYGRYEYLNWAPKFFIDSHMCEGHIRGLWADGR